MARRGFSARAQPSAFEQFIATRLHSLSIPAGVKNQANPFAGDPGAWRAAASHFQDHCAVCHGSDGRGMTPIGRNLYPKAPDMAGLDTQQRSDGELFYIISNGIRFTGMPGWGGEDSPEEIWQLVSFIRHLPALTPEEIDQMKPAHQSLTSTVTTNLRIPTKFWGFAKILRISSCLYALEVFASPRK